MQLYKYSQHITDRAQEASIGYVLPTKAERTSEKFQFSLSPSQNTAGNNQSSGFSGNQSNSNQYQTNQYTPGQAALQGQLGNAYGQFLQGNVPSSFTNNPDLVGAYTTAFNQNAPSMAFQGG